MKTINGYKQMIKGDAYLVKHINNKQAVRRIYKGTENRFDHILCYVFTGKVSKKVTVDLDIVKDKDGKETGVTFWHWHNVKTAPNEISIPYYDLREINEA